MLGLGLNLTSIGNSLLNVVRSGLQLWYKADETQAPLGEEEIIDGDFSPTSPNAPNFNDWSKGSNWTISGGYATSDGSIAGNLDQTALIVDRDYEVTLDVSNMTTSTLSVRLGGTNEIGNISENGTYTFHGTADGTVFRIRSATGFDGSVDNISVREVVNSVKDFSPNNNNGVLYSGKALNFDGASDEIDIGAIALTGEFTVALWYNVDDPHDSDHGIFGDGSTDNNLSVQSNTRFRLRIDGSQVGLYNFNQDVESGDWARIVLTRDSNNDIRVYRNNILSSDSAQNTSTFTVSNLGKQGSFEFDGSISDFQVYDKCWTASDVTYDYNNPDKDVFDNSNSSIVTTDCKALYRLNEGAGDRVYNAAPVLGEELIVNGDFTIAEGDTGDGWTTVGSAAITNGEGVLGTTGDRLEQTVLTPGRTYQYSFKAKSPGTGNHKLKIDSPINTTKVTITNIPVTYTNYSGTFVASGTSIIFKESGIPGVTIDNISVKEISLSDSYALVGDPAWVTAQPYIPQYAMSSYSKKLVFTDIDTDVDVGAQSVADNEAFSFSFWYAQTADSSVDNYIICKHDSTDDYIRITDQNETVELRVNGGTVITYDISDLTDFKLSHIVLTRASGNNPTTKCYVNGVLEATDTSSNADGVFEYQQIGAGGTLNARTFFLDELAHFNKELSETEVQEIFNTGTALDVRDHSAANTGSEVFANGFDTLNLDSIDSSAVTSSGRVTISSYLGLLRKTSVLEANTAYKVTMNIESFTSGKIYCGGTQITISQTGLQTFYVTSSSDTDFGFNDPVGIVASSLSVIEVNLKGYWRNNGTETWTDLSLYENDGTVSGSPTTIQLQEVPHFKKDTFGLPMNRVRQKGLNLDGDSYVKVDDDSSLGAMDDGFTCAFWYRHFEDIDTSNYSYLVAKGTGLGKHIDAGFCASVYDNKIYADLNTDTTPNGRFTINYSIGAASSSSPVWYYITATYNGSDELELYVDATSRGTASVTGSVSATAEAYPITIGTDKNYYSGEARAVVDEVKWYNRALSLSEIEKNHKATKSNHSSTSSWSDDFDDGFI